MGRFRRIAAKREETEALGRRLGESLPVGAAVFLSGDYGAGKTEFVRGVVDGVLGKNQRDSVASPSFSGLFVYEEAGRRVLHYDLYRFVDKFSSNIFLDAEDDDILCVEWAENILGETFRDVFFVTILILGQKDREIVIESHLDISL